MDTWYLCTASRRSYPVTLKVLPRFLSETNTQLTISQRLSVSRSVTLAYLVASGSLLLFQIAQVSYIHLTSSSDLSMKSAGQYLAHLPLGFWVAVDVSFRDSRGGLFHGTNTKINYRPHRCAPLLNHMIREVNIRFVQIRFDGYYGVE
jgi:hypothetical protein